MANNENGEVRGDTPITVKASGSAVVTINITVNRYLVDVSAITNALGTLFVSGKTLQAFGLALAGGEEKSP